MVFVKENEVTIEINFPGRDKKTFNFITDINKSIEMNRYK